MVAPETRVMVEVPSYGRVMDQEEEGKGEGPATAAAGKEQHWGYSEKEKEELVKRAKGRVEVQRYKDIGEMSAQQLWETTMNPAIRTILQVSIADAVKADNIFETLMGDEVPPRKAFIPARAKSVRNLDI